ncbi:MAG: CRTAC1 family protein [Bacteroidales bacterium]
MKIYKIRVIAFFLLLILLALLPSANKQTFVFTDVTRSAGIDFRYTFGDRSYVNILESSGSGVTVFDYNGDGLMDLLLLNGTYIEGVSDPSGRKYRHSHNELYRNNGNGTFTAVTKQAGLDRTFWSMAAAPVDIDHDGDMDLYLLNYGPNVFYRNNGNGTFTDITDELGLAGPDTLNGFIKWSIGASFWDYNSDGRLDVMVGNFLAFDPEYVSPYNPDVMPHPSEYRGQASMFYEQQPDGRFIDVTEKFNLWYPDSKCMGLTILDYDNDGDMDIFQANDHQLNFMFRNDSGKYAEVAIESGVAANTDGKGTGSMHGTPGDVDGDGLVDILVTDLEHGALYRNLGNGLFEDISVRSGIAGFLNGKGGWGSAFLDYDNDGDPDIVVATGTGEELILQYPLLLENDGTGRFRDSGKRLSDYFKVKRSGRGLSVWDFNNDGRIDIVINHVDLKATPVVLQNTINTANNWIGITLIAENGITEAAGANVFITADGRRRAFVNQWATSYLSNNDPRIHVGLGKADVVDTIEIYWPDGKRETYRNVQANRYITIKENYGIID